MRNKKLSIVIVNFRTYRFLTDCLKSIKNSKFPLSDLKIIVVDNNSCDGSVQKIRKHYEDVLVIANRVNIGFSAANNKALKKVSSEFVLFLNPDTLLYQNTISSLLDFVENNKEVGIVTCRMELKNGQLDDACHRGFPTPWNAFCQFSGLSRLFGKSQFFNGYHLGYRDLDKIHEIDSCSGAFMLVRRKAGEEIGWFDEDYFWYGEDIDFCYRLKKKGWKVVFYPYVKVLHYRGVSSGIKKHTKHISVATRKVRQRAIRFRFEVMRIFYRKHYQKIYPAWVTKMVFAGIKLKKALNLIFFEKKL